MTSAILSSMHANLLTEDGSKNHDACTLICSRSLAEKITTVGLAVAIAIGMNRHHVARALRAYEFAKYKAPVT